METDREGPWFDGLENEQLSEAAKRIRTGTAEQPKDWPALATEAGFTPDEEQYYLTLQAAAREAAIAGVREAERAEDKQVVHAIRAVDDLDRIANELAERLTAWGNTRSATQREGVDAAIDLADLDVASTLDERLVSCAHIVETLQDERSALATSLERVMPTIAPNLTALAGPLLGARLIALAGDLESLAKLPSGTVQVLGAEDALFAHLRGHAPSPKHGIIYTHEYVRGTEADQRGSAARAVAGKLAIAARIDHYAGDRRPALEEELKERIHHIRGDNR